MRSGIIQTTDLILAKRIFIPLVIRLCRLTRQNQQEIAACCEILAAFTWLWLMSTAHAELRGDAPILSWVLPTIGAVTALVYIVWKMNALRTGRLRQRSIGAVRAAWVGMFAFETIMLAVGTTPSLILMPLLLMTAEYARTVDKLPPKRA